MFLYKQHCLVNCNDVGGDVKFCLKTYLKNINSIIYFLIAKLEQLFTEDTIFFRAKARDETNTQKYERTYISNL